MRLRFAIPLVALALGTLVGLRPPIADKWMTSLRTRKSISGEQPPVRAGRASAPVVVPDALPKASASPGLTPPAVVPVAAAPATALEASRPQIHNPAADLQKAWLLAEGPHRGANPTRKLVTLTFDDGPGPKTTDAVLRVLAHYQVRGTFFLIGSYLTGNTLRAERIRGAARHIQEAGHLVGNHTLTHQRLAGLTDAEAGAEIEQSARAISMTTGQTPRFFRPPFGELDEVGRQVLVRNQQELVLWSIEGNDMVQDDVAKVSRELMGRLEYAGGGTVLLHDVKWSTVKVLDELLRWLRQNRYDASKPERPGYEVVDLPTYLAATAQEPQPYADRDELRRARAGSATRRDARQADPVRMLPASLQD